MTRKECFIYVGIDLHKETHTAVILNCWNEKLGEIIFDNKPSEFNKLTKKVNKYCIDGMEVVYGLENAYGYGRALAVWLIEKGYQVKDVNTALSYAQRKSVAMYQKNDSYDAEAVALVLINQLDKLPDAVPDDAYWTLGQLVNRRDNIKTHQTRLKNQLHEQLCVSYPSYKKYFSDISRQTALYFWDTYPSADYLKGKTPEDLAKELRLLSHNNCSINKAKIILDTVHTDGDTKRDYQESRDALTRSIVGDLKHYNKQLEDVEKAIEDLYPVFGCTLMTMPGIDITTATNILAEIGDINRFPNADKLAKFAGVAPVKFSSAGKGEDHASKQGNRRLQSIFYFLAIQMIQVTKNGTPRNAVFREYFIRRTQNGKNKQQVLICIARRLVNIIYGMLKNKAEYREPVFIKDESPLKNQ